MAKINKIPFLTFLNTIPSDVPIEFVSEVSNWLTIIKSPYGHSYYNDTVGWGYKEHNSLRLADHWNFEANFTMHCETTTSVPNNTHWTLARYDGNIKKYIVIKSVLKTNKSFRSTFEFTLLEIEFKRKKAIETIKDRFTNQVKISKVISDMDLKFLNLYFKRMEECF